jgi:hypothetical protein
MGNNPVSMIDPDGGGDENGKGGSTSNDPYNTDSQTFKLGAGDGMIDFLRDCWGGGNRGNSPGGLTPTGTDGEGGPTSSEGGPNAFNPDMNTYGRGFDISQGGAGNIESGGSIPGASGSPGNRGGGGGGSTMSEPNDLPVNGFNPNNIKNKNGSQPISINASAAENVINNEGGGDKQPLEDMKKKPPNHPEYEAPKSGDRKVRNPNGSGKGWVDRKGRVWVPDEHDGTHAPHWDRQEPKGGGYTPVYPYDRPVLSPNLRDRIGKTVGLTGGALTIYIIISEVSRLFPPRNLVPLP